MSPHRNMDKLLALVDAEWTTLCAKELVEIESVTMNESEVCGLFEKQMREIGFDVDVREVTPGRNNLYARLPGEGSGPTLLFNGHLDTIAIGDCPPCCIDGDRMYGRGTTDMKGGMAAMLSAARALRESGVILRGDVVLSAVVGHEEPEASKDGPKAFIEDLNSGRITGDRIIIVEGADELWIMSMGSMVFSIELLSPLGGRHTQYVDFKNNPIRHMGELITAINDLQDELDNGSVHPLAGSERIDLGIATAGDYFNRTPQKCQLTGTRRWISGRTADEVLEELKLFIKPFADAGDLRVRVTMEHEREPFETSKEDAAVVAVSEAHQYVTGNSPGYVGRRIVGDANLYVKGTGIPTFYYGPSNDTAHADVEWVSLQRMVDAARVYAVAAVNYCGIT